MAREKLVFNDEILDYLSERNDERIVQDAAADSIKALKSCMLKLSENHRILVEERYKPGASVKKIAADQKRTVGAISQTLYRIRHNLMLCVEKTLTAIQTSWDILDFQY